MGGHRGFFPGQLPAALDGFVHDDWRLPAVLPCGKVCTHVYIREVPMDAVKVGIREFREKLASYVLESDVPVAITRHGETVGYYIPARRKRSDKERTALKEAASQLQKMLKAAGVSEEEIVADFRRWRAGRRK